MTIPQRPVNRSTEPTPIRPIRTPLRDAVRQRPPHATPVVTPATSPVDPNRGLFSAEVFESDGWTDERSERQVNLQEIEQAFTPNDLARFMNLAAFMERHHITDADVWAIARRGWQHQCR